MDLDIEARRRGRRLRILVTRLRYLGDVIMTTPVVAALKRRYPGSEIHYLVERPYAAVLGGNPHIDEVISIVHGSPATVIALRRRSYTAALDLFYNPRSAWLLYLSGIPIRVGGERRWRSKLYTHTFSVPGDLRSAVAHHLHPLHLLDAAVENGIPRVYLDADEVERGRKAVETIVGSGGRIVAIHPGGTWPVKRWSASSFAELAALIRDRRGCEILLITGPGEREITSAIARMAGKGVHDLPVMPIRSIASIIHHCEAIIANDGGVMHLAVALQRPTVGVFGPTEPDVWFPYEGHGPYAVATVREDCAPCHRHFCEEPRCLDRVTVDHVYERLESVLRWNA